MTERLAAVILAAGAGTRLGGVAKALLKRGERTFLETIVATAREVGTRELVVVVGPPHGDKVREEAEALGARIAWNAAPERGMGSSVALGFATIEAERAWLWPVDHPFVAAATLRTLIDALDGHDAARPVVDQRGGHPPLVARRAFAALAACGDRPGGARAVLAELDTIDVPVGDRGCVRDVDTPEDLA